MSNWPQVRFKGFLDEWRKTELCKIANKVNEKNNLKVHSETFTNSAEFGIISQRDFFEHDISNADNIDNYYIVENNDFVYNPRISATAPVGPINRNRLGRTGVMSPLYNVFRVHDVEFVFLEYFFKSFHWHDFMRLNGDMGARSDRFSIKDTMFFQMMIHIPMNIKEQKKIGEFLGDLDELIWHMKYTTEKLQNFKKSMLGKFFPQNGSNVPEIRFKGFTDTWRQYKLGDVGKAYSGVGFPDIAQGGREGIPFFKVSDMNLQGNEREMCISQNYVTFSQIVQFKWKPVEDVPAIFFAKVGAAVMLNRKRLVRIPFLLDNNTMAYSLDKDVWDEDFGKALFETIDLTLLVQVGALPSYNASDIEGVNVFLPTFMEQKKIGCYFKKLDCLISFQQQKIEKLKQLKKALLEKMFV